MNVFQTIAAAETAAATAIANAETSAAAALQAAHARKAERLRTESSVLAEKHAATLLAHEVELMVAAQKIALDTATKAAALEQNIETKRAPLVAKIVAQFHTT